LRLLEIVDHEGQRRQQEERIGASQDAGEQRTDLGPALAHGADLVFALVRIGGFLQGRHGDIAA